MKFGFKKLMLLMLAAVSISIVSCKKDDDESVTLKGFSGTLGFDLPAYVNPGETYTLVPGGAYREDEGDFGYYWTLSTASTKRDTTRYEGDPSAVTGEYKFVVPDSLFTLTVSCYIYAEDYATSSVQMQTTIVDPEKTLTKTGIPDDNDGVCLDSRDGRKYYFTRIGNRDWFRHNLAYEKGVPYANSPAMQDIFGRYYTWNEALEVCPEGWNLPTGEDWLDLAKAAGAGDVAAHDVFHGISGNLMVDAYFNGSRLWQYWPEVKVTNSTGFSALPCGFALPASVGGTFAGVAEYAAYWTADEAEEDQAYYRYFYLKQPDVLIGSAHKKDFAANVRCVRDAE